MMWLNQLRGVHGSGMFSVNRQRDMNFIKVPACYEILAGSKKFAPFINATDNQAFVVGHNRFATSGKLTANTTHPFINKGVMLVHNGTLSQYPDRVKYEMDSHAIAELFYSQGVDKTIQEIDGSYSLVWYDKKDHTLNFLRNEERPMWFIRAKNDEGMFFASEPKMAELAMWRQGVSWGEITQTEPMKLYSWEIGATEPKVRAVEPKKSLPAPTTKQEAGGGTTTKKNKRGSKKTEKDTLGSIDHGYKNSVEEFLPAKWANENWEADIIEGREWAPSERPVPYTPIGGSPVKKSGLLVPEIAQPVSNVISLQGVREEIGRSSSGSSLTSGMGKSRIIPVEESIPFKRGATVRFSLRDTTQVREGSALNISRQVRVRGTLAFPIDRPIIIEGMVSKYSENDLIDEDCLFEGVISQIFMYFDTKEAKTGTLLSVREIRKTYAKDPQYWTKWEKEAGAIKYQPTTATSEVRKKFPYCMQCDFCRGYYTRPADVVTIQKAGHMGYNGVGTSCTCMNCIEEQTAELGIKTATH